MADFSNAGPGDGLNKPENIEEYEVTCDEDYADEDEPPMLVIMWHGNGYKRDDCWIQIPKEAACNLETWL